MVRAQNALPKLSELPPWEADIQELLHRFEEAVAQGRPFTFATFKDLWKAMSFSFIFEVTSPSPNQAIFFSFLRKTLRSCFMRDSEDAGAYLACLTYSPCMLHNKACDAMNFCQECSISFTPDWPMRKWQMLQALLKVEERKVLTK